MNINWQGITKGTKGRLALLFLVVAYLSLYGLGARLPVGELTEAATNFIAALSAVWLAWKNLSLTESAQAADRKLAKYKVHPECIELDCMGPGDITEEEAREDEY